MCSHFLNYRSKCRAPSTVCLLVTLTCSLFFTSSAACSNGNCQVLSLSLSLFSLFPFYRKRSMEIGFRSLSLNWIWQVLEACSASTDCGPGLFCGNCPALGLNQPICTRGQPTVPTSIVTSFLRLYVIHFTFQLYFPYGQFWRGELHFNFVAK